jgi:opacity protein-like surface antigen
VGLMMKKAVFFVFVLSFSILFAQEKEDPAPFTIFQNGVYGGINFDDISAIGATFFFEVKTNLIPKLNLKFSAGYTKSYLLESTTIKSYHKATIDSITFYNARTFNSDKKGYDIFPVALGFQYIFKSNNLSPYLLIDAGYNFISGKNFASSISNITYYSYEDLPDEFKTTNAERLPENSFGVSVGAGATYPISANLNLDFRYFYKIDSQIINTHNFVVGITF